MVLLWITIAISLLWVVSFTQGLRELKRTDHLEKAPPPAVTPFVSIVVPARNEELSIETCLRSLLAMDYPAFEIVVANDHSTDRTGEIAAAIAKDNPRVRVLDVPALPKGWTGKNWATHNAVAACAPDAAWFLFIDADTIHEPHALSSAMAYAAAHGLDMLSLFPRVICMKFWEKLLMISVAALITLFNSPREANDPKLPERGFANGQFILVRRETYAAAGGNEAVKSRVLEDVEFARNVKRAGRRTYIGYGQNLFGTRMYRDISSFHEGWTKNLFLLMGRRWGRSIAAVSASMLLAWVPLVALVYGVWALVACDQSLPIWGPAALIASYFLMTIFQITLRTIGNAYPAFSFLAPIGSVMTSWLVLRSAWLTTFKKGVSWKGRTYVD